MEFTASINWDATEYFIQSMQSTFKDMIDDAQQMKTDLGSDFPLPNFFVLPFTRIGHNFDNGFTFPTFPFFDNVNISFLFKAVTWSLPSLTFIHALWTMNFSKIIQLIINDATFPGSQKLPVQSDKATTKTSNLFVQGIGFTFGELAREIALMTFAKKVYGPLKGGLSGMRSFAEVGTLPGKKTSYTLTKQTNALANTIQTTTQSTNDEVTNEDEGSDTLGGRSKYTKMKVDELDVDIIDVDTEIQAKLDELLVLVQRRARILP